LKLHDAFDTADYSAFKWGDYDIMTMPGIRYNAATGKVVSVSKGQVMNSRLSKECAQVYIGLDRAGKTELQHADGRCFCRRSFDPETGNIRMPEYYMCASFDPLGVYSKDGSTGRVSSYHFPDTKLQTRLSDKISRDELKTILNLKEDGTFACRYHPGIIAKGRPVTLSFNAGMDNGKVDWSFKLREVGQGLEHLQVLCDVDCSKPGSIEKAERKISQMASDDRALLDRVIIYKIDRPLYTLASKTDRDKEAEEDVVADIAAEQAYLASLRQ
jgi:hypothetical protein